LAVITEATLIDLLNHTSLTKVKNLV
jgi:hypothetical protein